MSKINWIELAELTRGQRDALLKRTESDLGPYFDRVAPIIEAVRAEGDAALVRYARELDKANIDVNGIRATPEEFDRAFAALEPEVKEAIEFAVANIRTFHEAQMPGEMWMKEIRPGVFAGDRFTPIPSVACYVPRGKGSFPSVVMMTTVPAVVAGVPEIAILTPPGPNGEVDAATLVAARIAGCETVYKAGGAQAVAAAAFGTETVRRAGKIVGPGSPWVVAAKRLLAGVIDPGTPAGPSEAIVFADATVDGRLAALDLLIEAEHGPDSSAWLVTASAEVAEAARSALPGYWAKMGPERVAFSQAVLGGPRGGILIAPSTEEAIAFINDFAPEHLEILSEHPFDYLGFMKHAGEILLGPSTPITLANFVLGPDAVLPTGGAARYSSPLSVFDFLKRTSIAHVTPAAYEALAPHARTLARYEGFDAHWNALSEMRDGLMRRRN